MVPGVGIEPTQPRGPRDFKSLASTNSATQARLAFITIQSTFVVFFKKHVKVIFDSRLGAVLRDTRDNDEKWEVVHISSGMINAKIISGRLETEGIPVKLQYEAVGVLYGLTVDGLGAVKVLVPEEFIDRALEVINDRYDEADIMTES